MKVGFNTNVPFKGKTYHVQTEDGGLKNPVVLTLLYHAGSILGSRRTSYDRLIGKPECENKVQELMTLQHKIMIKELISGKYTGEAGEQHAEDSQDKIIIIPSPAAPAGGTSRSEGKNEKSPEAGRRLERGLDDVLLDFIMKKHKKNDCL